MLSTEALWFGVHFFSSVSVHTFRCLLLFYYFIVLAFSYRQELCYATAGEKNPHFNLIIKAFRGAIFSKGLIVFPNSTNIDALGFPTRQRKLLDDGRSVLQSRSVRFRLVGNKTKKNELS